MNAIVPQNFGKLASVFANQPVSDDLSAGVQASFGLIGYKGKVWSIKYRGDERPLMRDDGDGPRNSIEVVILKSPQVISKIWYEQGYVEGSSAAPDCFSTNGVVPEPSSAKRQSPTCATCPRNVWGSRVTPAGKQGKECADSKRLAVVPLLDIPNEMFGGPMLLRVPAASLQDLAQYGQKMQQMGYPYYAIGTRISFDPQEAYPKFLFNAIRELSEKEGEIVLKLRDSHAVSRILAEATEHQPAMIQQVFEQPPTSPPQNGTGGASTQSAPTAAPTGATVTPTPPIITQAPVIPIQQPSTKPHTISTPSTSPQESAGGATSASGLQITGFGAVGTANGSAQPQQEQDKPLFEGEVTKADVPSFLGGTSGQPKAPAQEAQAPASSSFEDELDAKLASMLS